MEGELGLLIRLARGEKVSVEQVAKASMTPASLSASPDISGANHSSGQSPFSLFGFGDSSSSERTATGGRGEVEAGSGQPVTPVKTQNLPGVDMESNVTSCFVDLDRSAQSKASSSAQSEDRFVHQSFVHQHF